MLRARSVLSIAVLADHEFTFHATTNAGMQSRTRPDLFAEFLFAHEFPAALRSYIAQGAANHGEIKRRVLASWEHWNGFRSPDLTEADRERWFVRLAEVLLQRVQGPADERLGVLTARREAAKLVNVLRLDGYEWADGRLRQLEENVFDVVEQTGALEALWARIGLPRADQLRHNLQLADEHYEEGRWGDCITHARHVVELTLRQVADARVGHGHDPVPPDGDRRPVVVRDHLRTTGFYDQQEQNLVNALYALVSREGGHPNMAPQESARILRQHAFTVAHFLLLRFEQVHGRVAPAPAPTPGAAPTAVAAAPAETTSAAAPARAEPTPGD